MSDVGGWAGACATCGVDLPRRSVLHRQHLECGGGRPGLYWTITRHLQYMLRTRSRASVLMI